jgi:hypothetical protein
MGTLRGLTACIPIALGLALLGCSSSDQPLGAGPSTAGLGSVAVSVAFAPASPFAAAARTASVTITAPDMSDIVQTLSVGDSTVSGSVDRIPAGPSRVFRIDVLDSTQTLAYQGRDTADVVGGSVVTVEVVVKKL